MQEEMYQTESAIDDDGKRRVETNDQQSDWAAFSSLCFIRYHDICKFLRQVGTAFTGFYLVLMFSPGFNMTMSYCYAKTHI